MQNSISAQMDHHYRSKVRNIAIGAELGFLRIVDTPLSGSDYRAIGGRFAPTFTYLFKGKFGIGAMGELETFKDTDGNRSSKLGYGLFLRYYPIDKFKSKQLTKYIRPYIGAGYNLTNYFRIGKQDVFSDKIENSKIKALAGFQLTPWRGLAIDFGYRYVWFFDSGGQLTTGQYIRRIALEYHF